jgi:protoheme IX farnesyltransferase
MRLRARGGSVTVRRLVIGEPAGALRVEVTPDHHPEQVRPATLKDRLHAYFALTKPRIIELLLITTVPAMIVAERGLPSLLLIAAALVGGSLAAGGANVINCYVDRDIDEIMPRTRRRPLPQHKISPRVR